MVALGVISLVLIFKFGFGFGSTTITETVDSPDQSEKVSNSQNEQLSNSEEVSSHNTNSWHINIGSGLAIMALIIIIGGLTTALKYYQKTNVCLAQERRLLQSQMSAQDHEQDRAEVDQGSSKVSGLDKNVQNFHNNYPIQNVPQILPNIYQPPYVEQIDSSDINNQFYPQLQNRRHQWAERDHMVQLMYNPIYPGYQPSSNVISGYSQSLPPKDTPTQGHPHPSAPLPQIQLQERVIQSHRKVDKAETEMSRQRDEAVDKEEDRKEIEALRRQNQLLVNKFQQFSIEADI